MRLRSLMRTRRVPLGTPHYNMMGMIDRGRVGRPAGVHIQV